MSTRRAPPPSGTTAPSTVTWFLRIGVREILRISGSVTLLISAHIESLENFLDAVGLSERLVLQKTQLWDPAYVQHGSEFAPNEIRRGIEALKRISAFLVIIAEAHVNPCKPEVRRNLDRVYDHIQHPRITNCTA